MRLIPFSLAVLVAFVPALHAQESQKTFTATVGGAEEIIKAARQAQVAIGGIGLPPEAATYEVVGADIQLLSDAFDRAV